MDKKKIQSIVEEYEGIEKQLMDSEVVSDPQRVIKLSQERAEMEDKVVVAREYLQALAQKEEAEEVLGLGEGVEMQELAEEQKREAEERLEKMEGEIRKVMLKADPDDKRDVIIEIRAGAGGDEAALFGAELGRAYLRFAEENGFVTEFLSKSDTENGGAKEWIFRVKGEGAYAKFKYESGVHRVQRVPVTESQGRVHTSTCSVAVMPELPEEEVEINQEDLRIDVFRSSGHGGQSVNTTDSAVRVTHLPTGMIVTCQDEKSQLKNKKAALAVLAARLKQIEEEKRRKEESEKRMSQIGTGDRSEKIRTYNFPQSRVTDHRIKQSWSDLTGIMEGRLGGVVEELAEEDILRRLKSEDL